jgi:hypothetical protein
MHIFLMTNTFGEMECVQWDGSKENADEIEVWSGKKVEVSLTNDTFSPLVKLYFSDSSYYNIRPQYWIVKGRDGSFSVSKYLKKVVGK